MCVFELLAQVELFVQIGLFGIVSNTQDLKIEKTCEALTETGVWKH